MAAANLQWNPPRWQPLCRTLCPHPRPCHRTCSTPMGRSWSHPKISATLAILYVDDILLCFKNWGQATCLLPSFLEALNDIGLQIPELPMNPCRRIKPLEETIDKKNRPLFAKKKDPYLPKKRPLFEKKRPLFLKLYKFNF